MTVASRRVAICSIRLAASRLDPRVTADEFIDLIDRLTDAATELALEESADLGRTVTVETTVELDRDAIGEQIAAAVRESIDRAALSGNSDGSAAAIQQSAETPQARATDSAASAASPATTELSRESSGPATGAADPIIAASVPRGESASEPPAQRHSDTVRGLAEIPLDERTRMYDAWLTSRKANGNKVPATELEAIAEDFNTTARVVYNFCYARFNNPPNGNGARKVDPPKVTATTERDANTASRQKALAALSPPAPRVDRLKVTRMRGTYGGGE